MRAHEPDERITVYSLLPKLENEALRVILQRTEWRVFECRDAHELEAAAARRTPAVVVAADALDSGLDWRSLMDGMASDHPVQVIVASRLADEGLWADVLNRGAFDLVEIPFRPDDVTRSIAAAWRQAKAISRRLMPAPRPLELEPFPAH